MKLATKRIICLYGGSSCGKSTACAGLYYKLKLLGYECEMNREYIKDWIWENRAPKDGDQSYFFAKMARRERLYIQSNLDFIITDSPLILTHFYGLKNDRYEQLTNTSLAMLENHHLYCVENGYKIDHFFLKRCKKYSESGRYQTEEEAKVFDEEIKSMLAQFNINYKEINSDKNVAENLLGELGRNY